MAAWLCGGEQDGRANQSPAFDAKKLQKTFDRLRGLTLADQSGAAIADLRTNLADCGVAFVLRLHLPKTYLTGATFWLRGENKAVLMMSIRGSWADIFWFTLFHELCHILKHDKRRTFVDYEGVENPEIAKQEAEAGAFARDTLIPARD